MLLSESVVTPQTCPHQNCPLSKMPHKKMLSLLLNVVTCSSYKSQLSVISGRYRTSLIVWEYLNGPQFFKLTHTHTHIFIQTHTLQQTPYLCYDQTCRIISQIYWLLNPAGQQGEKHPTCCLMRIHTHTHTHTHKCANIHVTHTTCVKCKQNLTDKYSFFCQREHVNLNMLSSVKCTGSDFLT